MYRVVCESLLIANREPYKRGHAEPYRGSLQGPEEVKQQHAKEIASINS